MVHHGPLSHRVGSRRFARLVIDGSGY
jgi:hypothetical protein